MAAALLALAGAILGAGAAAAQEAAPPISPLRVENDVNGVNIIDGKTTMPLPVLGVPAAPRLRYDRAPNAAPRSNGLVSGEGAGTWSIHTGMGTSEQFQCSETASCDSVTESGSYFRSGFSGGTYKQAGTGAIWWFNIKRADSLSTNGRSMAFSASSVSFPDGETISYTYEESYIPGTTAVTFRPTRLTDSLGYFIQLNYAPGDPDTPGWDMPSSAALYASSNPTTPLQQINYATSTATQVGTDGTTRTFSCDSCIVGVGASSTETTSGTSTLPGESTPTLQVSRGAQDLVSTVVRDGVTWTYTYTNARLSNGAYIYDKVTVDGPNGYHIVYDIAVYEGRRNVISAITDSLGRKTGFTFDLTYQPTRIVQPELDEVSVLYDVKGNIYQKTTKAKPGSGLADLIETASYPLATCANTVRCFRPDWYRDAMGRQTDFVWNDSGQLTEQTDPADAQGVRRKTYITYDGSAGISRKTVVRVCGDITTCGTANEVRTEYDYAGSTALPSAERRIDAATGVTLTTTYTYDTAGRPLVVDGPVAGTDDATYFRYDGWGRKTWEIGPKGANGVRNAKRYTRRASDNAVTMVEQGTLPDENSYALTVLTRTDTSYDSHRNPIRNAVSSGTTTYAVTDKSFDDRGELVCQAQRMNPAAFAQQPGACAFTTPGSQGPDRITHNVYDSAGQLLQVQKAYGVTTANFFPQTLQQNYATYEYTLNGKQNAVIDANGNRAEMTFDGFDRQRRWVFPSPTTAGVANQGDYEEYGYDTVGNRTSLRKRDGVTLTYQYDNLNRLRIKTVPTSATFAAGYSVYYGYDVRGLQTWARFGSDTGPGIANTYDGFGRLVSSATSIDGTARTLTSTYDAGSNRIGLNGDAGAWGYTSAYSFDAAGRLTGVIEAGHPVVQIAYDTAGRRSSLGLGFDTFPSSAGYLYDDVGRLQSLSHDLAGTASDQTLTFGYNSASQVVTRTSSNDTYASNTAYNVNRGYSVNGLNQYTAAGGATFQYDANGNLTSDGTNSYVYDAENRLVSASGGHSATLSYDPMGRLWQVSSPTTLTRFLYDGDRLAIEYDSFGSVLRSYDHGTGADEPLVWYEAVPGGTSRRYLHADHQGSIVAVADQNGNLIAINAYDAWGIPNAGNLGRFGYTGQAWLPELGMWYYKARIYSPTLGRFLQTDPVGYEGGADLYAYGGNDPVNHADPTGLTAEIPGCATRMDGESTSGCLTYSSASIEDGHKSRSGNVQFAMAEPPEEEENAGRNILGIELDFTAPVREARYDAAYSQLKEIEPYNPALQTIRPLGQAPNEASVNRMEAEVATARARQALAKEGVEYVTSRPGTNVQLRGSWGSRAEDAARALRENRPAPEGVSRQTLRAYRDAIEGIRYRAGYREVYVLRLELLDRWLGK